MNGKEAKEVCNNIVASNSVNTAFETPVVAMYGVISEASGGGYSSTVLTYTTDASGEESYVRSEEEIRDLKEDIYLWLSGMGEYPEEVAEICPIDIIGDFETETDEDELNKIQEKIVIQVLRWVLGEI